MDVHRRPLNFFFADALAQELDLKRLPCPAPLVDSCRVGEPAAQGGRLIGFWPWSLLVGEPWPEMPLALSVHVKLPVNLEATYCCAAADVYLP